MFLPDPNSNTAIRFYEEQYHSVVYKFKPNAYTIDEHLITERMRSVTDNNPAPGDILYDDYILGVSNLEKTNPSS